MNTVNQLRVTKRNGEVAEFSCDRIENAIILASKSVYGDSRNKYDVEDFAKNISATIYESIQKKSVQNISVEDIQDIVEVELIKSGNIEVAKAYILYREERTKKRDKEEVVKHKSAISKIEKHILRVTKRSGEVQVFDENKLESFFNMASEGYESSCEFKEVFEIIKLMIVDKVETSELIGILRKACIDLISIENTGWQHIAGRIYTLELYGKATENREIDYSDIYTYSSFISHFDDYIEKGFYYKDFYKYYSVDDIKDIFSAVDYERDFEYGYSTMLAFNKRYLLNPNKVVHELPQEMYMAVAMFLAIPEDTQSKRNEFAKKIYKYCSSQKISLPTPTLLNARTNYHQLSSCFKLNLDDDLRGIYHQIENMAQISKYSGGIGAYMGNIRAKGSSIRGEKNASGGVIPWVKVINDTATAANQLGSRSGAISTTIDMWHLDVVDFLNIQTETGDIRSKAFDVFPAISVPDIFMKRVEEGGNWTMFDPHEVEKVTGKRLQDHFDDEDRSGDSFTKFYERCERNSDIELRETMPAKDLMKMALKTTVETGMPYFFFRDTVNRVNPNKHAGNVYSSQLCVAGDTKILTKKYGNIEIEKVSGLNLECWNGKEWSFTQIAKTGENQDVMEVKLSNGRTIVATPYHEWCVKRRIHDISSDRNYDTELKVKTKELSTGQELIDFNDPDGNLIKTVVLSIKKLSNKIDTYCGNEPKEHKLVFNGVLTFQCTEIAQNTSPSKFTSEEIVDKNGKASVSINHEIGDSVVCNLASINMAKVNKQKDIETVIPVAMRILDNVISLNFYPTKESEHTAKKYRSVGLGFLGLAEYLAVNKLSYDKTEAREVVDELFERYAFETLKASVGLSHERGQYELFKGSEWSKGLLFGRDGKWYNDNAKTELRWDLLIDDVVNNGLRFSYHLSPAPNTSTAGVVGTTAGLLPIYKKLFVETNSIAPVVNVAPNLNSENFWYYKEYQHLDMIDVIDMISTVYKWVDQAVSFEWMINPAKVSPAMLYSYYMKSWKKGIKTVYYVRSMSGEIKEDCASCSG